MLRRLRTHISDWLFVSPDQIADYPQHCPLPRVVKELQLLLYIAQYLEYEVKQGYRGDREITLPPPCVEIRDAWLGDCQRYIQESGWEAVMQADGCIRLKPLPEE